MKLKESFYLQKDVVDIAKQCLGKRLCTNIDGQYTSGIIVETEAYRAPEDMASHAYDNKVTPRTKPFFEKGGIGYVYLIYGTYKLFNLISNVEGIPHAILIRGIEPEQGIDVMMKRRKMTEIKRNLSAGPGLLSMALGIDLSHNRTDLQGDIIWLEDRNEDVIEGNIISSPRVGMNIPEPWYSMPWRFRIKGNNWTSPAK